VLPIAGLQFIAKLLDDRDQSFSSIGVISRSCIVLHGLAPFIYANVLSALDCGYPLLLVDQGQKQSADDEKDNDDRHAGSLRVEQFG
jgi:hypothetical protein